MNEKMTKVLLLCPLIDVPTITSSYAVYKLMEYCQQDPSIDVDVLAGVMANRLSFNLKVKNKKYDLISYWGHGYPNKLQGTHVLLGSIIDKRNIHLCKGIPMHVMACWSLKGLGRIAIEKGVPAYWGTDTPYWSAFPEKENDYLNQWINYTTIPVRVLLEGGTFADAYYEFQKMGREYVDFYASRGDYRNYDWYEKSTLKNISHSYYIGDGSVRIR